MSDTGYLDLTRLLRSMAGPARTEATLQSEIHTFLLSAGLNLSRDDLAEMTLESPSGVRKRIDIQVGNVCIEVKRQLSEGRMLADAVQQLEGYVAEQTEALGHRYVGILTDGSAWKLYHLGPAGLELASTHTVRASDPDVGALRAWLAGVLTTEERIRPTAKAIRSRLGAASSGHQLEQTDLRSLYEANRDRPEVIIKKQVWAKLLTTALGTQFHADDHDLFVEHTLLVATAEVVAHAVVGFDVQSVEPAALLGGDLFSQSSAVHGVVEHDFFDWPLDCGPQGHRWVRALARRLDQFDWASTRHDAMKTLYEAVISTETRKTLGEYYTPDWLAEKMVNEVVTDPLGMRVLDPSCGSGTFLFHAVRRYLAAASDAGYTTKEAIAGVVGHVTGVDVHPVATTLARVTYLLAIGRDRLRDPDRDSFHVPVYLGDSVQWGQEEQDLFTTDTFKVDVNDESGPLIPEELRFPRSLLNDADRFDQLVAELATAASSRAPGAHRPSANPIARRHGLSGAALDTVVETFNVMCDLHDQQRDHIWGYYVRNLARPAWLGRDTNRVDVLVGNPPWLAYRFMTKTMQATFKSMATLRGLWGGGSVATQQDLSDLFVVRCIEQYLRLGGRFSFVMPAGVLTRGQYAGFRSAMWRVGQTEQVFANFDPSWDLSGTMPPYYFPRTCAVVNGTRVGAGYARQMPTKVEDWVGSIADESLPWADVAPLLRIEPAEVVPHGTSDGPGSPWRERFTNGATIFPRVLTTVELDRSSPLGSGARRQAIRSYRGVYEKAPWKHIDTLHGTVELEFVRPLLTGEAVLPFRQLVPPLTVLPINRKGSIIEPAAHPGLNDWWAKASRLWDEFGQGTMSLVDNVNYRNKLVQQFPVPPHRVVVTHSGMHVTACRVTSPDAIVEHQLDWAAVKDEDEGRFLCAVLNSPLTTEAAAPFMTSGKGGGRHIGKSLWNVPIPLYNSDDEHHRALAALADEAERLVAELELPDQPHGRLRGIVRTALDHAGITERINSVVREVVRPADPGTF